MRPLISFNIAYKIHLFLGNNLGGTRHPYEKNKPTLDHSGGGVHGKACWLIAYIPCNTKFVSDNFHPTTVCV